MPSRFRTIAKRTMIAGNIFLVVLFLLSCLAPYVKPTQSWFISFLGLAFPILFVCLSVFILFWLMIRRRYAWLSVIALLLSFNNTRVSFAFNAPGRFEPDKKPEHIRIASWNVARFLEWKRNNNEKSRIRQKMLEVIKNKQADILCLQEFFHSPDSQFYHNVDVIKSFGYPYFYFSYDPDGDNQYIGSAIFSKYPMIDSGLVRYFRPSMPEALVHADIRVNEDTIRVFATHLQSVQFRKPEYDALSELKSAEDSFFVNSKTVLAKLRKAIKYRSTQADVVQQIMEDSPYPSVLCADLNDIPNSYTYATIRGDMRDVFLEKGFGIGRTFSSLSPILRIDYIFTDPHFEVKQFTRVVKNLSDHFMLLADVELQRKK